MVQNIAERERKIILSGYLFIAVNFLLGLFNIVVGLLSGSLAITSDAVHSFIDSISGFLIIISEKLSNHHKIIGYKERIERCTTIIIALIIILAGIHIIIESIEKIQSSETPDFSIPTIIVIIASIALKYTLAAYLKNTGKKYQSTVLVASGAETFNDTLISVTVLFSTVVYLISHINIEAYVGILIACVIIKVGLEFIFPHLSHHHPHHLETNSDHDHCQKPNR